MVKSFQPYLKNSVILKYNLSIVSNKLNYRTFYKNQEVFIQGDSVDYIYFILDGEFEINLMQKYKCSKEKM